MRGWKRILVGSARDVDRENLPVIAGGLAFFALLSATPMLIAVVSIYGLVADPATVGSQVNRLAQSLPDDVRALVVHHVDEVVRRSSFELELGALASLVGGLWAASKGTFYLFRSLNIAYGVRETRRAVRLKATSFLFTLLLLGATVVTFATVKALPDLLGLLGVGRFTETLIDMGRWPALAVALVAVLGLLYRYGPARPAKRPSWLSPGSVMAAPSWLVSSWLFSLYVETFALKFVETYGNLATLVVLMLWLYLSASLVLIGAVINANVERAPGRDLPSS